MVSVRTIFEEFQTYLSNAVQTCNSFLITGDFNVHMDIDTDRIRMCEVLTVYDLTQVNMFVYQLISLATAWI